MKKALALIAALLLTVGAVSCKKVPDPSGGATSVEDTVTEPSPAQPDVLRLGEDEILKFAQSFCDGAAWIYVERRGTDTGKLMMINTEGKVLFSKDYMWDNAVTNFCRGTSLYYDNGAKYIIRNDGAVVWCDADEGYKEAGEYLKGESVGLVRLADHVNGGETYYNADHTKVKNSYYNGFSVAVVGMSDGSERYGVIDSNGKWVIKPSKIYKYSMEFNSGSAYTAFRYDRDGNFYAFDFNTGELTDLGKKGENASSVIYPHESEITLAAERKYELEKGEGLLYSREKKGFTDVSGEVVIDLSGYSLAEKKRDGDEYIPYFHGGKCVITFTRDGKPYFAVIDREGNVLSGPEPFPSDDLTDAENNRYAYVSEGTVVFTKESDPKYYMYGKSKYGVFFGEDGKVREDLGKYACVYPFSDGIALTLDESGEYNYIDKNGNILFR